VLDEPRPAVGRDGGKESDQVGIYVRPQVQLDLDDDRRPG
jgi:hypothetical protein